MLTAYLSGTASVASTRIVEVPATGVTTPVVRSTVDVAADAAWTVTVQTFGFPPVQLRASEVSDEDWTT
jgi:hypothetical protein